MHALIHLLLTPRVYSVCIRFYLFPINDAFACLFLAAAFVFNLNIFLFNNMTC